MNQEILDLAALPSESYERITEYENSLNSGNGGDDERMDRLFEVLNKVLEAAGKMSAHGIPEKIIIDTFSDIGLWSKRCMRETGGWGLADPSPGWLKNHLACGIFRIGRIQCKPSKFSPKWNMRFYRNKSTGKVLGLTAGDIEFREDGQVSGTNDIFAGDKGFKGYFKSGENFVEGVVISPYGRAENKITRLEFGKWEEILCEGMPVFELHIPADGGFTPDICRSSYEDMVKFAKNHQDALGKLTGFEGPYTALTLGSWLLDAQLDGILPPESNLVKHLREYYLLPVLSNEWAGIFWIFNNVKPDLNNLKPLEQYTSLQRAELDFIRKGGNMRYNFGVLMFDDVKNYGNELYRKNFGL